MPNPDGRTYEHNKTSKWDIPSVIIALIVLWNVLVVCSVILGKVYKPYTETRIFNALLPDVSHLDNSPSCRYEGDCDYQYENN
jgi:hypothetical protein